MLAPISPQVILGGGRSNFLPVRKEDEIPLDAKEMGKREDEKNLIIAWNEDKKARGLKYKYVSNRKEFDAIDPKNTDYLLGKLQNLYIYISFWKGMTSNWLIKSE